MPMLIKRLIQCIAFASFFGLVRVDTRAEPILLVEIHKQGSPPVASGAPVRLEFVTEITDHTTQTVFGGDYNDSHEGVTFEAPLGKVADFETAFTAPTGRFWIADQSNTPGALNVDDIWNPPSGALITVFVPRLGHGLTGYNLTRVTHTIDQFDYFTVPGPSGGPRAEIRQTIAIYGEPVPEPAVIGLLIAAHSVVISRRFAFRQAPVPDL
jgi:hypothetical protein